MERRLIKYPSQSPPADESGHEIISFLDEHRLPHTPGNYTFVHRYFEGADEAHFMAVATLIDGGVRLRPEDIRAIAPPSDIEGEAATISELSAEIMAILEETASEATALVRTLTLTAAEIIASEGRTVPSAVARMTATAERAAERLSQMSRQTAAVRTRLTILGVDTDIDPATALLNRLAIDAVLTAVMGRDVPRHLALISLDQTTEIARDHGIGVVERVLRAMGETLRDHCLPHRVGRWEAKELAVVFEDVSLEEAHDMLDGARKAFGRRNLKLTDSGEALSPVSLSAGLAQVTNGMREDVIQAADDRLRTARASGANRIVA